MLFLIKKILFFSSKSGFSGFKPGVGIGIERVGLRDCFQKSRDGKFQPDRDGYRRAQPGRNGFSRAGPGGPNTDPWFKYVGCVTSARYL